MLTIATICARGGSKGLPGKNIRDFGGKPLIAHTILLAKACAQIDHVYVSTDSEDIAAIAREYGALVPYLRPAELASDSAAKLPAIEHLLSFLEASGRVIGRVVDLQPTSPLTAQSDLSLALAMPVATELVVSVTEPSHNPYYTLVEEQPDGHLGLSKPSSWVRRQDAPHVWGLNGAIYVWRRDALQRAATQGFWSVKAIACPMPRERSVDIDDIFDFEFAQWLYLRHKEANP